MNGFAFVFLEKFLRRRSIFLAYHTVLVHTFCRVFGQFVSEWRNWNCSPSKFPFHLKGSPSRIQAAREGREHEGVALVSLDCSFSSRFFWNSLKHRKRKGRRSRSCVWVSLAQKYIFECSAKRQGPFL